MSDSSRLCGARIKYPWKDMPNGTTNYRQPFCCNRPVPGKKRCRFHGGKSTGPKTPEGVANSLKNLVEGRRAYDERMRAEGKKFPWGRRKKSDAQKIADAAAARGQGRGGEARRAVSV